MIKRIKRYLDLQRRIQGEVLETLCSICLFIEHDGHFGRNPYSKYMITHFKYLKDLSEELRKDAKP